MATEAGTETSGYDQLRHRAYLFVRDEGGAVAEERLIDHVFGSAGNPALWRPLLRQVLRDDERLTRRVDGYWALHGVATPDPDDLPRDYVVVDVETTGLKPLRARLIEVAAIRYRGGAEAERFSTLVNPDRRVPAYITQLTGIDEARLAGAPPFRDVASSLLRFLGDDLVVGFNVAFDLGFINAELKRLGRPGLTNPWLDLLPLANQLVPGVRKPGLDALCRSLGLPLGERHRAEPDAEATALLFGRLLELARERGLTTLDGLWRAADV
ncbi:MAG: 3'-5' exonuclease, partial [Thermomicrobiaceae bacterium]|nr:3'-5' exonuclease [Thermomicrobiaceae bacterium]